MTMEATSTSGLFIDITQPMAFMRAEAEKLGIVLPANPRELVSGEPGPRLVELGLSVSKECFFDNSEGSELTFTPRATDDVVVLEIDGVSHERSAVDAFDGRECGI